MFKVTIVNNDNTTDTYDCLTKEQATYIFQRAKKNPSNLEVTMCASME